MSYEEYKKKKKNSLGSLQKELEKINTKTKSYDDDRYWKLSCDKSGNGYAIIRFLPAPVSEDIPWVQIGIGCGQNFILIKSIKEL